MELGCILQPTRFSIELRIQIWNAPVTLFPADTKVKREGKDEKGFWLIPYEEAGGSIWNRPSAPPLKEHLPIRNILPLLPFELMQT